MIGFNRLNLFNRGESKKISRAVIESFIRFIQRWRVRLARKINLVYIYIYRLIWNEESAVTNGYSTEVDPIDPWKRSD